jgi:hypothetical protein
MSHGSGDADFIRFEEPVDDSFTLVHAALRLLYALWDGSQQVSFLAVTYSEFGEQSGQIAMDPTLQEASASRRDHPRRTDAVTKLSRASDVVRDKYGDSALILGSLFGISQDDAPDRIGFRKIEGVEKKAVASSE